MNQKAFSRRAFVSGLAASIAAGWICDSQSLSARVIRGAAGDFTREVKQTPAPDLSGWSDQSLDVCWIGHATVLINFYGFKILTDPVFFDRVGLGTPLGTIGRKRLVSAPFGPKELPKLDLLLISHAHMDHLDFPSLEHLERDVPVVTARKTADLLREAGFRQVTELGWGDKTRINGCSDGVDIAGFEVKHWGARIKTDTYRGYNGYTLKRGGKTVIFGGDTALCGSFRGLKSQHAEVAIMPIGSYGSKSGNHCTPEESVKMTNASGADYIIPIHHSTFPIGMEPIAEPLERLESAISSDRIALRHVGEAWTLQS